MSWPATEAELTELGQAIVSDCGGAAAAFAVTRGELSVRAEAARVAELMQLLRDSPAFAFEQLIDLCGADYPQRERRFDVVYHLLSMSKNRRLRVNVEAREGESVPSITPVYPAADWFEREAFDLYGVPFAGHPDLRRILTDYGFEGHPLRKDFPMTGHVEVRWDQELRRVVYEPVKSVEFRSWDFLSPWEGSDAVKPGQGYPYQLPGEEKA